ncbi:PREDICTED: protein phosphatase 2, regulatory subunit B, gamma [Miniopterus natalensis]|uniref:protein phosphatase 2, regulatory subunit B, gamma n=1 Tax=Miniopterus natalensis TaxID=291302 RepID=UPI0007A6D82B|nr:PREDICTED: protein phosphatase 2, regulatory subunit B, gamma [Miniopterus natalensis]
MALSGGKNRETTLKLHCGTRAATEAQGQAMSESGAATQPGSQSKDDKDQSCSHLVMGTWHERDVDYNRTEVLSGRAPEPRLDSEVVVVQEGAGPPDPPPGWNGRVEPPGRLGPPEGGVSVSGSLRAACGGAARLLGREEGERYRRGLGPGGPPKARRSVWVLDFLRGDCEGALPSCLSPPPADIISTVEFNHTGELLATGDKGGRVVIFQREPESKNAPHSQGEYDVYSTFQSHEPEFDYLKSLEIEEKINKIKWLPQQNAAHSLLSTNDKTIKLWKITERDKRPEGYNLKDEEGKLKDLSTVTSLQVPVLKPMDLMVEVSPRRVFANGHTYHINSISINSDCETYMSADDLRINLWHLAITDRSFNIVDIKPANMEDLTEVITASEFHPHHCNLFVYSSSKGSLRLCDMRAAALCDKHSKLFEEPEDPSNRSFFSEIISSVSDVKFSHSGRYMLTRDYLTVKVWDLNMEARPIETYQVHDYLRSKLCSLYENDCIFDKFECAWNGSDSVIMTGAYNNFFRMFDRNTKRDVTLEASRESSKPRAVLKPRRVCVGGKRRRDDISVDSLDFTKKILHTAWHPAENIIAIAATNNLYIFQDKVNSEMH